MDKPAQSNVPSLVTLAAERNEGTKEREVIIVKARCNRFA